MRVPETRDGHALGALRVNDVSAKGVATRGKPPTGGEVEVALGARLDVVHLYRVVCVVGCAGVGEFVCVCVCDSGGMVVREALRACTANQCVGGYPHTSC